MRICEVLRIWALLGALFAALPNCAAAVNDGKGKAQQEEQKVYLDATKEPFEINGFPWRDKNGAWYRLPPQLGKSDVNEGALKLAGNTSGGTIRFMTDSPNIHLVAKLRGADMNHMPRAGSAGIDIFLSDSNGENSRYVKTLQPSAQEARGGKPLASSIRLFGKKDKLCTLYLPLYGKVNSIAIAVDPGCKLWAPPPHRISKPILFYGSSITQGGCASRPANNYTTMLCRHLDAPQINMGFSGSAKGEPAIAEAIASLDLAAFVYDYDYNAPNVEHLKNTHKKFFDIIRGKRPNLPIIILSRCSARDDARSDAIKATYEAAKNSGDKLVWFIDGAELFGDIDNYATCDGCHPNDLGFYMMYRRILPVLLEALEAGQEAAKN